MEIRKITVFIVVVMILIAFTPLVFGASEDTVLITFDPDGDIDIDIAPETLYNFSSVLANAWANTTGETFLVWNNGTVSMDTQIQTNTSTEEGDMSVNGTGAAPGQDEYGINITGLSTVWPVNTWVHEAYGNEIDQSLGPGSSNTFDINLRIGTSLSANHSYQTTTINFTGTQS